MFIADSAGQYPYVAMWGAILVSAASMIILNLLYGEHSLARDINTLKFYGLLCHLVYIPCYYYGFQLADYHNGAAQALNYLILLRLFYFGSRDLLSKIAIIDRTKDFLLSKKWFLNRYLNGLTLALFFLCAVPLFTLIYVINTDKMRVTGISIILFVFFIAIEYANKKKLNRELLANQEITRSKTVSDATRARVLQQIERARREVLQMRKYLNVMYGVCGAMFLLMLVFSVRDSRKEALIGYATGYVDAKTGKPPRAETDIQTLMDCFSTGPTGRPLPPSPACAEITKFKR
jgi:ABC-type multidrug transport system fused ATPase/permease subunit